MHMQNICVKKQERPSYDWIKLSLRKNLLCSFPRKKVEIIHTVQEDSN